MIVGVDLGVDVGRTVLVGRNVTVGRGVFVGVFGIRVAVGDRGGGVAECEVFGVVVATCVADRVCAGVDVVEELDRSELIAVEVAMMGFCGLVGTLTAIARVFNGVAAADAPSVATPVVVPGTDVRVTGGALEIPTAVAAATVAVDASFLIGRPLAGVPKVPLLGRFRISGVNSPFAWVVGARSSADASGANERPSF